MRLRYYRYSAFKGVQKIKTRTAIALSAVALAVSGAGGLSLAVFGTAHASPTPQIVYDALPDVSQPTNFPSQPFQAQQTNEFGDYVHLAGTARQLNSVTVTMSDWALASTPANVAFCSASSGNCDSTGFFWPITVNIYANTLTNDVPNHLLGTKTVTVHIPWRPEGDPSCATTSNGFGWKVGSTCYNYSGIASNATFDLSNLNLTLPNDVIVGFVYNTQTYGPQPTGVDGPYNSLNIAVPTNDPVTVGTDDSSDAVFWNTNTQSYYTNQNCTGGTFCLDTNWTPYGTVAMQITATSIVAPVTKDDCKNGGWATFNTPETFKNQGDCVSLMAQAKTTSYTLNSNSQTGTSFPTKNGVWYEVTVSGTWTNRSVEQVDATCTSYNGGPWANTVTGGYDPRLLDVQVNQSFVDWGTCQANHTYTTWVQGTGSPVNLRVFDGDVATNTPTPSWYSDNVGSLSVGVTTH